MDTVKSKSFFWLVFFAVIIGMVAAPTLAKPDKCSPWPDCRDSGGDEDTEEKESETDTICPATNVALPKESMVLATPDSIQIVQQTESGLTTSAEFSGLGFSEVGTIAIGDTLECHPGNEILVSGTTQSSSKGKGKKSADTHSVKTFVYDGSTLVEVSSFSTDIRPFSITAGSAYPSTVDQVLVESPASSGTGTQIAELYESDGAQTNKVHEFSKDSTGNFWSFIGDFNGNGIQEVGIQMGDFEAIPRGFALWEYQNNSWSIVDTVAAGDFIHDDGELVDVDNDGVQDLVTTGSSGDILVLQGGTFNTLFSSNISDDPTQSITTGQFNNDSCVDIAVSTTGAGSDAEDYTLALLEGDCNGGFTQVQQLDSRFDSYGTQIRVLKSGDLNSDGIDELYLHQYDWDTAESVLVSWEYDNSTDAFTEASEYISAVSEGTTAAIASAVLP